MRNNQLETAYAEWWAAFGPIFKDVPYLVSEKGQLALKSAFQAGASAQAGEVETALRFAKSVNTK